MIKIDIIGRGNVGKHLAKAYENKADVVLVDPRTFGGLRQDADFYLISVSDNAILEVTNHLYTELSPSKRMLAKDDKNNTHGAPTPIVAHTSGSVPARVLSVFPRYGVFYPLQTFTANRPLEYLVIPFFIEGNTEEVKYRLMSLAGIISEKVTEADSDLRRELHVASVFSCNFVNHLWALSYRYLAERGIDFSLLYPLISETVSKIKDTDPALMQTGPASRGDSNVISRHIKMLEDKPEMQTLYTLLSESVINLKNKMNKS